MTERTRSMGSRGNVNMTRSAYSAGHTVTGSSHKNCDSSSPNFGSSMATTAIRDNRKTMVDTVTPGYFSLVRKGDVLPVQTCTSTEWKFHEGDFLSLDVIWDRYVDNMHDVNRTRYGGGFPVSMPTSLPEYSVSGLEDHQSLLTEALAAARSDVMDGSTFLAELGKTYSMVTRLGIRIAKARREILRAIKNGTPWAMEKTFNQIWLEGRYGWRILKYEAQDVHETVKRLNERAIRLVRKSRGSMASSSKTYGNWIVLPRGISANYLEYRTVDFSQVINRAGVGVLHSWKMPIQFDPLVTGWELIPFSFVVDWFLSIGAFIEAASPFMNGDEKFRWTSTESRRIRTFEFRYNPTQMALSGDIRLTGFPVADAPVWEYKTYSRTPTTLGPTISFKVKMDEYKMKDLMALFTSFRFGSSRS